MIYVRIKHLPPDSATVMAEGGPGWRLEHYLAAHLFHATTGNPHPMLPKPDGPRSTPERDKAMRAAMRRAAERRRAIQAGEIQ